MGASVLTSLASVKEYLGITDDTVDGLLTRLIKSASTFVLNYLNRNTLELQSFSEMYDAYGSTFMILRRNPVYTVSGVSFSGVPKLAATGNGINNPYVNGWVLSPAYTPLVAPNSQRLDFHGYRLPNARASVYVEYQSGFVMVDTATIPAATPFEYTTSCFWLSDVSVVNALDNTLFTKVETTPAVGEYSVSDGVYLFNEDDAGVEVSISYSYVPPDIQDAVIQLVCARYRYMDRIGYVSKSLGGQETVTFSQKAMDDLTKDSLNPYRNVIPV